MNRQNPKMKGNTTYIRFKNAVPIKENSDSLIAVFKKHESKLEFDKNSLKQLSEKNIGKTFELVFNMNVESETEFKSIRKDIAIELRKLEYKIDPNFFEYNIII